MECIDGLPIHDQFEEMRYAVLNYYFYCIRWIWKNRNWKNNRHKWKAMDRDYRRFDEMAKAADRYMGYIADGKATLQDLHKLMEVIDDGYKKSR
jgi:hypothetical protein